MIFFEIPLTIESFKDFPYSFAPVSEIEWNFL